MPLRGTNEGQHSILLLKNRDFRPIHSQTDICAKCADMDAGLQKKRQLRRLCDVDATLLIHLIYCQIWKPYSSMPPVAVGSSSVIISTTLTSVTDIDNIVSEA